MLCQQRSLYFFCPDTCDFDDAPASTVGWHNLSYSLTATMDNLSPDTTYYYRVGEPNNGYSKTMSFKSPPNADSENIRIIAFGDMGSAPVDGAHEQSWDNHNEGELGALYTMGSIEKRIEEEEFNLLLHFGDISYATGFMSQWDEFMSEIEPIASRIPY
eukprot:UN24395